MMHEQSDSVTARRNSALESIRELRLRGEQTLLASGVIPDTLLHTEQQTPGADQRGGVNLVARPPAAVRDEVTRVQRVLQHYEPHQYYYPTSDLHLTVLEVCADRPLGEVASIAEQVVAVMPSALQAGQQPTLEPPIVGYDARACALNVPLVDDTLARLRAQLTASLEASGIALRARYAAQSAHVTFLRYIEPLRIPPEQWIAVLRTLQSPPTIPWMLNELWVTWGATWYGRQARIAEAGPFSIGVLPDASVCHG